MSKVVFVGNVPYTMGEDQLIDVFKSVGQVIGFRLVFDRDTGKPKGYGFCEFADHETAASAVRNLNNVDVGGRPLRIDLADSDPFLEGKTTVRGELLDGGFPGPSEPRSQWRPGGGRSDSEAFLANLPPGKTLPKNASSLDVITQILVATPPAKTLEVLAQMKAFVITHPDQARTLLVKHPQLSYALFQALLLNNIVDQSILERMIDSTKGAMGGHPPAMKPPASALPPARPPPMNVPPSQYQHLPPPPPSHYPSHMPPFPPQGSQRPPMPPPMPPIVAAPPTSAMYSHQQQHQQHQQQHQQQHPQHPSHAPPMQPNASYYRPPMPSVAQPQPLTAMPPPPATVPLPPPVQPKPAVQAPAPEITDAQRMMLMQVLTMSQDQINGLAEAERSAIMQLRSQFSMGNTV